MEAVTEMQAVAALDAPRAGPAPGPQGPAAPEGPNGAPAPFEVVQVPSGDDAAPADVLTCYPQGCAGCPNRTVAGGCRLMDLLAVNGIVTLNEGPDATGPPHPGEADASPA